MNYLKMTEQVKEFNVTFGNERFYLPGAFTKDRESVRDKWFFEEYDEYLKAVEDNDKVEILDAICDMLYIHIGTLLEENLGGVEEVTLILEQKKKDLYIAFIKAKIEEYGFEDVIDAAFDEVHRSNMSKLDDFGKPIYLEDGKIGKSANFFRPNLKQFVKEEK